jgi:hypothetical protein
MTPSEIVTLSPRAENSPGTSALPVQELFCMERQRTEGARSAKAMQFSPVFERSSENSKMTLPAQATAISHPQHVTELLVTFARLNFVASVEEGLNNTHMFAQLDDAVLVVSEDINALEPMISSKPHGLFSVAAHSEKEQ